MATGSSGGRARRSTSWSSGTPSEEGRAFFQERLSFFAKIALVLSSGFFVFSAFVSFARPEALPWLSSGEGAWHLAANGVLLATWLWCARGTRSFAQLRVLEAATVVLYCAAMCASVYAGAPGPGGTYTTVLAFTSIVIGRAVLMPSTPARTLGLSATAALPLVLASWAVEQEIASTASVAIRVLWVLLWCVDAVALSAVASHVIYGLRQRVREAMRLGQYTLAERIGGGGMGEVYKASHALLKRPAAVKLLPPEKVGAPALARFEREVQLTSQLTHPNTIAIFDYGHTASGIFYYAMEYLDGVDLERLVRTFGPLPTSRVVHVLRQVTGALQEAHDLGLIHRDVKPANVILCRRGGLWDVAKVVDFGLVKDLQAAEPVELTGANTIAGTPLYLSPEAISSAEGVGPESDLYALGAVGYFLVTGRPPFEGSLIQVCGHHLHTTPARPSDRLGAPVPQALEDVLMRCLEKDPTRRYASATALADALDAVGAAPWTQADARTWWERHQDLRPSGSLRIDPSSATQTMVVSLEDAAR
ncbi:MAG: serine/threonine-protein kinase [Vicinamibacteria bacterium]